LILIISSLITLTNAAPFFELIEK